jgi:lipopolysaccharide/colanic/teichoic acid biosynthesis glycosyltransferase
MQVALPVVFLILCIYAPWPWMAMVFAILSLASWGYVFYKQKREN